MDASEIDVLVQRLVANPHDQEALAYAHNAGNSDPKSYAVFLEKVGNATLDPAYASHWLSEAANVWSMTLGDAHRAARVLMAAVDRDPTQETAAERLAQLYRDKGEHRALAALLERRAKALLPLLPQSPDLRSHLAGVYEELGRVWSEPPLLVPKKGVENYRRAIDLDPSSAYAVYALRELYKQAEQWNDALPLFAVEQAIISDPARKLALYRDEAEVRKLAGDRSGATQILREARGLAQDDPVVVQELGASILERIQAGETVSFAERQEAAELFRMLAETYEGEHGLAYSLAALDAQPGDDRSMQLAAHHARALGRSVELASRWAEYSKANPNGALAREARRESGSIDISLGSSPPSSGPEPEATDRSAPAEASPPPLRTDQVMRTLEEASTLAARGQRPQALAKYKDVLTQEPAHPEALAWVEDYLRQKRQYAELRDVLMQAVRSPNASSETRKQQLLEVAGICETQLRDVETAIQAWKQICSIDRADGGAREHLRRLLERGGRWDELANVLEQEAMSTADTEAKVALEKKLAQLHEVKRKDLLSAGESWARIASMLAGDELPIHTAVRLFEKAQRRDLACQVLAANAGAIEDKSGRSALYQRLGELHEKSGHAADAGEAYVLAAEADGSVKMWEAAERSLAAGEQWTRAAYAVTQRAELVAEPRQRAALFMRAAGLLAQGGEPMNALLSVEGASALDPLNDEYAAEIEKQYTAAERFADLAEFLGNRASKLDDKAKRTSLRKKAATLLAEKLGDSEGARETLLRTVEDGDDAEVLLRLADDAETRGDAEQARDFLHRLVAIAKTPEETVRVTLREANLLAGPLLDADGAIARYTWILDEVDPKNREAVQRIAELEEKQNNPRGVVAALEREFRLVTEPADKLDIARRLAPLYENSLGDAAGAVRALDLVHELDPEDYEATARLEALCEKLEDWPRVATLLHALAEIEGDEVELSLLAQRLAAVLADKLDRGDEALAALLASADAGDEPCRDAYVELADRLGWKGLAAAKLVEWHGEAAPSQGRNLALRGAFDRFLEVGRLPDAAKVGIELCRSKAADRELADQLEELAVKLKDLDALACGHDVRVAPLGGLERALELVRQAEVLVSVGVDPVEAQQHGEPGLSAMSPSQVEPLLARLAALTEAAGPIIDVYERQVARCKTPADRLAALARAAQVAVSHGARERAASFYDLALASGVPEETLLVLELSATQGDRERGGNVLRATLAEALSRGGTGSRDGGRTRALLLRRAAEIANRDLGEVDRAFQWLGDALIAHVDAPLLDALEELAEEVGDVRRAETTLGRALSEVFDGPLVRQLLARRIKLRRDKLGDRAAAAEDLKKLHDLSPSDATVMDELSRLLTELGDFRGMVHVLEDQILRSKEPQARAELARKVARLWEDQLQDPREAADAWRRVLRMKPGDSDAQAGLERAKSAMLKHGASPPPPAPSTAPASVGPSETKSDPTETKSEAAASTTDATEPAAAQPAVEEKVELAAVVADAMGDSTPDETVPDDEVSPSAPRNGAEHAGDSGTSLESADADADVDADADTNDMLEVDPSELVDDDEEVTAQEAADYEEEGDADAPNGTGKSGRP